MSRILFHCHTTFSNDGKLSCAQVAKRGSELGFDFIFLSDHYEHINGLKYELLIRECNKVNEKSSCKLIPGYEKSWNGIHICGFNLNHWIDSQDYGQWCSLVSGAGGMVVSAHPLKYDFKIPRELLAGCEGVEVWNSKWPYDGPVYPHPGALAMLEQKIPIAGQDVHKMSDFNRLAIVTNRECQSATEVLEELRNGNFQIQGGWFRFHPRLSKTLSVPIRLYQATRRAFWFGLFNLREMTRRQQN